MTKSKRFVTVLLDDAKSPVPVGEDDNLAAAGIRAAKLRERFEGVEIRDRDEEWRVVG